MSPRSIEIKRAPASAGWYVYVTASNHEYDVYAFDSLKAACRFAYYATNDDDRFHALVALAAANAACKGAA